MKARLDSYRIFYEVAKHQSLSKASEILFVSQPAISQSIKQLETSLNCSLFHRHAKGVSLTKEGELLFSYVKTSLDHLEVAEKKLEDLKNLTEGSLIIGAGDTVSSNYLLSYLEHFHALYPFIKVEVRNGTTPELVELAKSGKVDLIFINLPLKSHELEIHPCLTIHDIFVCGNNYPIKKSYTREEIAKEPLILLEKKSNSRLFVDAQFKKSHIKLEPAIELGAHELLLQFAKIHLGISCVTKEFSLSYLNNKEVQEIKLKHPLPERYIGYAYHKSFPLSPTAKAFIKLIQQENQGID